MRRLVRLVVLAAAARRTGRSAGLSSVASTRGRSVQAVSRASQQQRLQTSLEVGMPSDAPVVGEAVERAVRVEGLVVGAKPDARILGD